jgi:hypothetical protein
VGSVHSGLVAHKVLEVSLDLICYFDDMAFNLALEPETEGRMVDAGFTGDFDLLNVVLVDYVL